MKVMLLRLEQYIFVINNWGNMTKEFFIGKANNTAKKPSKILVGNSSNIAKEVKSIFVGNSSNKAVKVFPSFPDTYQKVEYIFNTGGTQYINTGVKPNSNTTVYCECELSNRTPTTGYIFGCYNDYETSANRMWYYADALSGTIEYYYGSNAALGRKTSAIDTRYKILVNVSGGEFYLNNESLGSSTVTFPSTYSPNILIFAAYAKTTNSTPYASVSQQFMRLYHFQIKQDNILARDMYPCYLKSDTQTVGMYDLISGQFYANSGTGIFYKGPDVN